MTREERIRFLEETLAIDTTNANEKQMADCIRKYLSNAGISSTEVEYAPGRNNLVAEIGTGGPVFGLSGHMDVVPVGDASKWGTSPFVPTEKEGKLYARGADDMKSGLVAMVIAMIELVEEKILLAGRVRLLATVAEESGLRGAEQLTKAGYADGMEALIVGEPSGRRIVYAHKGICNYTGTSFGKSAHSSMPQLGVNAIDNLLVFYNRMMDTFAKLTVENAALGGLTYCNSMIQGGRQANMVPDLASFTANLRTIPEADNERTIGILQDIIAEMNRTIPGMNLKLEVLQSDPPMFSNLDSKLVVTALAEAKKMFGEDLPVLGAPGATDAAKFVQANKDMQIIIFGPGSDTMHQDNEYVAIDNYLEMIDLYKNIIKSYLGVQT